MKFKIDKLLAIVGIIAILITFQTIYLMIQIANPIQVKLAPNYDAIIILSGNPARAEFGSKLFIDGKSKKVLLSKEKKLVRNYLESDTKQMTYEIYFQILIKNKVPKDLINLFGNDVTDKGHLVLSKLAQVAFSSKLNQDLLNGIMWPEIYILINKAYETQKNKGFVFFIVDAALIYEANFQNFFDKTILITTKKEIRIKRAIKRHNLPLESIHSRISLQMSDNKKKQLADYIITNNSDLNNFHKKIDKLYSTLLQ